MMIMYFLIPFFLFSLAPPNYFTYILDLTNFHPSQNTFDDQMETDSHLLPPQEESMDIDTDATSQPLNDLDLNMYKTFPTKDAPSRFNLDFMTPQIHHLISQIEHTLELSPSDQSYIPHVCQMISKLWQEIGGSFDSYQLFQQYLYSIPHRQSHEIGESEKDRIIKIMAPFNKVFSFLNSLQGSNAMLIFLLSHPFPLTESDFNLVIHILFNGNKQFDGSFLDLGLFINLTNSPFDSQIAKKIMSENIFQYHLSSIQKHDRELLKQVSSKIQDYSHFFYLDEQNSTTALLQFLTQGAPPSFLTHLLDDLPFLTYPEDKKEKLRVSLQQLLNDDSFSYSPSPSLRSEVSFDFIDENQWKFCYAEADTDVHKATGQVYTKFHSDIMFSSYHRSACPPLGNFKNDYRLCLYQYHFTLKKIQQFGLSKDLLDDLSIHSQFVYPYLTEQHHYNDYAQFNQSVNRMNSFQKKLMFDYYLNIWMFSPSERTHFLVYQVYLLSFCLQKDYPALSHTGKINRQKYFYDCLKTLCHTPFDKVDASTVYSIRLFAPDTFPFDSIINFIKKHKPMPLSTLRDIEHSIELTIIPDASGVKKFIIRTLIDKKERLLTAPFDIDSYQDQADSNFSSPSLPQISMTQTYISTILQFVRKESPTLIDKKAFIHQLILIENFIFGYESFLLPFELNRRIELFEEISFLPFDEKKKLYEHSINDINCRHTFYERALLHVFLYKNDPELPPFEWPFYSPVCSIYTARETSILSLLELTLKKGLFLRRMMPFIPKEIGPSVSDCFIENEIEPLINLLQTKHQFSVFLNIFGLISRASLPTLQMIVQTSFQPTLELDNYSYSGNNLFAIRYLAHLRLNIQPFFHLPFPHSETTTSQITPHGLTYMPYKTLEQKQEELKLYLQRIEERKQHMLTTLPKPTPPVLLTEENAIASFLTHLKQIYCNPVTSTPFQWQELLKKARTAYPRLKFTDSSITHHLQRLLRNLYTMPFPLLKRRYESLKKEIESQKVDETDFLSFHFFYIHQIIQKKFSQPEPLPYYPSATFQYLFAHILGIDADEFPEPVFIDSLLPLITQKKDELISQKHSPFLYAQKAHIQIISHKQANSHPSIHSSFNPCLIFQNTYIPSEKTYYIIVSDKVAWFLSRQKTSDQKSEALLAYETALMNELFQIEMHIQHHLPFDSLSLNAPHTVHLEAISWIKSLLWAQKRWKQNNASIPIHIIHKFIENFYHRITSQWTHLSSYRWSQDIGILASLFETHQIDSDLFCQLNLLESLDMIIEKEEIQQEYTQMIQNNSQWILSSV